MKQLILKTDTKEKKHKGEGVRKKDKGRYTCSHWDGMNYSGFFPCPIHNPIKSKPVKHYCPVCKLSVSDSKSSSTSFIYDNTGGGNWYHMNCLSQGRKQSKAKRNIL